MLINVEDFYPLIIEAFKNDKTFSFPIKGTSMRPLLKSGDIVTIEKREAIEWEDRSNACVECLCSEERGLYMETVCLSTEAKRFMCGNDGCLDLRILGWAVEINVEGMKAVDFTSVEIAQELKALTGVDVDPTNKIGMELGEEGSVVRVIVFLDDEKTSQKIADAVNALDNSKCHK